MPGLPGNNNFKVMSAGAMKVGYKECNTGHMAINSTVRDDRTHCFQRGFCFQGCRTGAKWSTLYTELPRAQATGHMELRPQSHVVKIEHDARGKATGVVYYDEDGKLQRQKARVVAVAGNSIETPRLLLNSHSSKFPDGLANGSGQVGRNYMRHTTGSVYGVFNDKVEMFKGTTMAGIIEDEAVFDPKRGFAGGYHMETRFARPAVLRGVSRSGRMGAELRGGDGSVSRTRRACGSSARTCRARSNRITLNTDVKDQYGLPVPNVHFDDHPNDEAMREHAYKQGSAVYEAAGAKATYLVPPYPSTHNLGTARMSAKAGDGVCNSHGQTHEVANLFISDGSQFTTGAAENPTLTIVTLAIRQADYIAGQMKQRRV